MTLPDTTRPDTDRPPTPRADRRPVDPTALASRLAALDDALLRPPTLPDTDVSYWADDTAVGRLLFAVRSDGAVVASRFAPDVAAEDAVLARVAAAVSPRVLRSAAPTDAVRNQVEEFLAGRRHAFDVRTDLALAPAFQRAVLDALRSGVPYGAVTTYGALAAAAGRPAAARAVGAALGANPLCVVVPCHRVLAAGGSLSGYAGGPDAKRLLLDLERPESRPGTAQPRPTQPSPTQPRPTQPRPTQPRPAQSGPPHSGPPQSGEVARR